MSGIMRDCPDCPDICQDRHRLIYDLLYRIRDAGGGTKGLVHRFAEQIAPGAKGPGTSVWKGHEEAYYNSRRSLNKELKRYENSRVENEKGGKDPCPPTPLIQEAKNWADRPSPTEEEWKANNPEASSGMDWTPALRVGAGVLGTVAAVGTVAAFLIPFDGPVGEMALGSATAGLWGYALSGGSGGANEQSF